MEHRNNSGIETLTVKAKDPKEATIDSLKDLPHVGPVSLKRLYDDGITNMLQLKAELTITEFMAVTGMDRDKAEEAYDLSTCFMPICVL